MIGEIRQNFTEASASVGLILATALVEFAFLFISFQRLRLDREQIRQILLDLEQLTSDTRLTLEKLFLKRAERNFRVTRRSCRR